MTTPLDVDLTDEPTGAKDSAAAAAVWIANPGTEPKPQPSQALLWEEEPEWNGADADTTDGV